MNLTWNIKSSHDSHLERLSPSLFRYSSIAAMLKMCSHYLTFFFKTWYILFHLFPRILLQSICGKLVEGIPSFFDFYHFPCHQICYNYSFPTCLIIAFIRMILIIFFLAPQFFFLSWSQCLILFSLSLIDFPHVSSFAEISTSLHFIWGWLFFKASNSVETFSKAF